MLVTFDNFLQLPLAGRELNWASLFVYKLWCQVARDILLLQATKPNGGFQTARTALAVELRKSGRQLPLQPRDSGSGQRRGGVKESDFSSGCMFPEGQGAFNRSAAPRQGMLRGRDSSAKRPEASGSAFLLPCNALMHSPLSRRHDRHMEP